MNINFAKIISDKISEMETEGTIKKQIEDTIEKSILDTITTELNSYSFKRGIADQVKASVSSIAADCGFPACNGFIAERVKTIVQEMFTDDISAKVQNALNDVLLKKHENIKLSDIFARYREWVLENTDQEEKYERQRFTSSLEIKEDGAFTHYSCRFADRPLEASFYGRENPDIEIRFCVYVDRDGETQAKNISSLYLDGRNIKDSIKISHLTVFEAFVVNLYYNDTEILLDAEAVDESCDFIDY